MMNSSETLRPVRPAAPDVERRARQVAHTNARILQAISEAVRAGDSDTVRLLAATLLPVNLDA